jgi:hypothetical protein
MNLNFLVKLFLFPILYVFSLQNYFYSYIIITSLLSASLADFYELKDGVHQLGSVPLLWGYSGKELAGGMETIPVANIWVYLTLENFSVSIL